MQAVFFDFAIKDYESILDLNSQMPEVYLVLGNNEKMKEQVWKNIQYFNKIQVDDILKITSTQNHIIEKC